MTEIELELEVIRLKNLLEKILKLSNPRGCITGEIHKIASQGQ